MAPVTRAHVCGAVAEYGLAWTTQDPARIGALFSEDAVYVERAYDRSGTFVGRAAIEEYWRYQICGKQRNIEFRHVDDEMVLDGERPQAVVKWLAAFDNRREKRGAKASKRVQFCQLAKLMFDADGKVCYLEEYAQSVSGPSSRWPPLDAPSAELWRRVRREQTEVAKAAVCGVCGAAFPSKSKLFAHLRTSACGDGAVAGAAEPTTFLCVYAAYADGAKATAALLARFGAADAEFRAWAVPPSVAPNAARNVAAVKVRKRDVAGLALTGDGGDGLSVFKVREADRAFADERRQFERYAALIPWALLGAAPSGAPASAPAAAAPAARGPRVPFEETAAAAHVDKATVARLGRAARAAAERGGAGWLAAAKPGRVRARAMPAPYAAWAHVSLAMRQPKPGYAQYLVALLVGRARGALDDAGLAAAMARDAMDLAPPLPAPFLCLVEPVMHRYEAMHGIADEHAASPEADDRAADAAFARMVALEAADGALAAWAADLDARLGGPERRTSTP